MAEPSTLTATALNTAGGLSLALLLPYVDATAVFGAFMGAAVVASTKKDVRGWTRVMTFLVSAVCGYFMAPEIINKTIIDQSFTASFVGALMVMPISLTILARIDQFDIGAFFRSLGGRP